MNDKGPAGRTITRRAVVAGAAAGGLAVAADPALAQRCPPAAARTKGPLVWMDLDQLELDEAYDQSVYAFNQRFVQERRDERNALMAKIIGKPERVAYGPAEIEKVDIYRAKQPNAPVMIFLHGGAWRGGTSAQGAYHAEPFVKAGAHFINVEFNNVLETKGDLLPMVDQCRRAVAWIYKNAASFGGDPERALSQRVLVRQSSRRLRRHYRVGEAGAAARRPQGRAAGIGHVRPRAGAALEAPGVREIHRRDGSRLSAMRHHREDPHAGGDRRRRARDAGIPAAGARVRGGADRPGKPAELIVAPGYNHYETGETIGHPMRCLAAPRST